MDARTLRAAVAAAMRVTVSTTLIGCGGSTVGDGDAAAGGAGRPTMPERPSAPGDQSALGGSPPSASGSGNTLVTGGTAVGGVGGVGGSAESAGAGGAPTVDLCGAVDSCIGLLESLKLDFDDPLPNDETRACCATVLEGLDRERSEGERCDPALTTRFMLAPAHTSCCRELDAFHQQACTPWGPPVPPELLS